MSLTSLDTTPAHVKHGVKTGLACLLAYYTALLVGLPYGFWAAVTTVIVMQFHVADSMQMSWYRLAGTAVGAVIGMLAILMFPETPWWTGVGLFATTGFCAYMTRYNEKFRMAAITVVIVFLTSLGAPDRLVFTLQRVLEISIGVCSAFGVSLLLWPVKSAQALQERLAGQFTRAADKYDLLMRCFLDKQTKVDAELLVDLDVDVAQNRALFNKAMKHENVFFHDDVDLLSLQIGVLNKTLDKLHALLSLLNEVHEEEGYDIIMAPELTELAICCEDALRAIGQGRSIDSKPLAVAADRTEARLQELRIKGAIRRFNARKMLQVLAFLNSLQLLADNLLEGLWALEKRDESK